MIGNTFQFDWEVKLIEWCQNSIPSIIIDGLTYMSYLGDAVLSVAIICIFYLWYDKKLGRRILFTTITSMLFACEIKNIFKRRRPYFDNENIECLKIVDKEFDMFDVKKQGFSFPSLHSSNTVSIFGTIYDYYRHKPLLIIAIVIPLIVGTSRYVLGCHYPTDVIVGWMIGLSAVIIYSKIQTKLSDKQLYICFIVLGLIGITYCESADFFQAYGIGLSFILCEKIDKKYINFKNTRNPIKGILRLLFGLGVFVLVSQVLKLPFSKEFLEGDSIVSNLYLAFRYGLSTFAGIGLTPIIYKYNVFKLDDRFNRRWFYALFRFKRFFIK